MTERRNPIFASVLLLLANMAIAHYWNPVGAGPPQAASPLLRRNSRPPEQPAGELEDDVSSMQSTARRAAPPDQAAIDAFYRERGFVRVPLDSLPATPITSPILLGSSRRVPRDTVVFLDLSYSEIELIAGIHDRMKPRIQEMLDHAAAVEVRDDGLLIRYRFDPAELVALNSEIDREIQAGLDPVSQRNYDHLDRRSLLDSFTPYPLLGLSVEITRADSLLYTARIKSSGGAMTQSAFRTGSGGMVLDEFYGSIVRRHFPRAVADEAEYAARKRAETKNKSQ